MPTSRSHHQPAARKTGLLTAVGIGALFLFGMNSCKPDKPIVANPIPATLAVENGKCVVLNKIQISTAVKIVGTEDVYMTYRGGNDANGIVLHPGAEYPILHQANIAPASLKDTISGYALSIEQRQAIFDASCPVFPMYVHP